MHIKRLLLHRSDRFNIKGKERFVCFWATKWKFISFATAHTNTSSRQLSRGHAFVAGGPQKDDDDTFRNSCSHKGKKDMPRPGNIQNVDDVPLPNRAKH